MASIQHTNLSGADLHPPEPHTHRCPDLSSFAPLDKRCIKRAQTARDYLSGTFPHRVLYKACAQSY